MSDTEEPLGATLRDLIDGLHRLARILDHGLDTPIKLGVCDGRNVQMIDRVDVDVQTFYARMPDGFAPGEESVVIRGHHHAGEVPGELGLGVVEDPDEELRSLLREDEE